LAFPDDVTERAWRNLAVEAHLPPVFRKVDVRSRTQLTRRVLEGTVQFANPTGLGFDHSTDG